jgi:cytochrome b
MSPPGNDLQPSLIWDAPTRLFHWALASSFALGWLSAGSDAWLSLHVFCGYLMLGLVTFRLIWGFAGSFYSRFASFCFSPRQAFSYLKAVFSGRAGRFVGHNPTGSLAIYLLLGLALAIGVSGILTLGAEEQHGLAAGWFSFSQGRLFKQVHELLATLMLSLVGLHIAGVVAESFLHKENLARAMLTGIKLAGPDTPETRPRTRVALLMLVLMLGFGGWWFNYALQNWLDSKAGQSGQATPPAQVHPDRQLRFVGPKLADNPLWREECGSCHGLFHPSLLPARSWQKMLAGQDEHFGTDLALDEATRQALLAFLVDNAAERHATEAAFKIDSSTPKNVTPLKITATVYWQHKHREIPVTEWASPLVKTKSACAACHSDADSGGFEDGAMAIPR